MSSELLGSAQNVLKGNLGGAWDITNGYQDAYTDLGIARRFGGAAAAYSLRDIGAMNGRVVRVRRDTGGGAGDNDEEDFSASQVASGALESFVGAGNDGFVSIWYDQSGNGNDATQGTAGSQPAIVENGGLIKLENEPSIKFDGTDDFLERANYTQGDLSQPSTGFAVAKLRVFVDDNQKIFDGHTSTKRNMIQLNQSGSGQFAAFAGSVQTTGEDADADQHLFESRFNAAASRFIIDGEIKSTNSQGSQDMQGINIGANHDSASNFWDGDIQEIIIYNSDLFDDRADLENDINNYYTIY